MSTHGQHAFDNDYRPSSPTISTLRYDNTPHTTYEDSPFFPSTRSRAEPMARSILRSDVEQHNNIDALGNFEEPADVMDLPAIDHKTKLAPARIKKLIQSDQEVGKLAQAVPTAVARALEQFIATMVAAGAVEAASKNTKRVTPKHLQDALAKHNQFDWCEEYFNVADSGERSE